MFTLFWKNLNKFIGEHMDRHDEEIIKFNWYFALKKNNYKV